MHAQLTRDIAHERTIHFMPATKNDIFNVNTVNMNTDKQHIAFRCILLLRMIAKQVCKFHFESVAISYKFRCNHLNKSLIRTLRLIAFEYPST
jgi:hypothetical protein